MNGLDKKIQNHNIIGIECSRKVTIDEKEFQFIQSIPKYTNTK